MDQHHVLVVDDEEPLRRLISGILEEHGCMVQAAASAEQGLELLLGNVHELTQVVGNMIFNAVEAMPDGGELAFKSHHEGDCVFLEVSDTGVGMDDETLALMAKQEFDVVVTDLGMAGLTGLEVAEKVKRIDPEIPVVLLSGWAVQQDEASIRQAGIDYILAKPCSLEHLADTIQEALETL